MSTEIAKDSNYVIPAGNDEKQRLGDQYVFKKSVAGWTSAVPASVDVSRVSNVLDMAAGTCAWILDFASMPQVQERLSILGRTPPRGTTSIQLYACDIDVKFLPGLNVTDPLGIATFQQDVTKPFPKELHGTFDLVHMSHLLLCLTEDGWKATLRNALDILKPGGLLMLEEADPVLYGGAQPIPAAAEIHDLEARLKDSSWVGKANAIYTRTSLENNFIVGLSYRLPELLVETGFDIIDRERCPVPWGKLCLTTKGAAGGDLSQYNEFTVTNMQLIFKHLAAALLSKGKLVYPDGNPVSDEDVIGEMLSEVAQGMREEGAFSIGSYFVSRRKAEM